jgi:hypothetical protein
VIASLAAIVAVAVALLWGCGFLVARLFLPRRQRPVLLLVAPFLGFSLISAGAHYAGTFGAPLRSIVGVFVVLAAAGWILVLGDARWRRPSNGSLAALAICLVAFLLAIRPLFVLGYVTTLGETIDAVSYAVRSEYLQGAPLRLPEIEAGKPYLGWVRLQLDVIRAGDVYVIGLVGLLTGKRSHELLTVLPALFFALTSGAAYVLSRIGFRLRRPAALAAAGLVAVHNLLLAPLYDNFVSQGIGLAFLPLVLAFGIEAGRRFEPRSAALFAVLWTGLVSVYPTYALCGLLAVLAFWGLDRLLRSGADRWGALGKSAGWWLAAVAFAALWNGVALKRAFGELGLLSGALGTHAQQLGGNLRIFPPITETFGLVSHAAGAYGSRWESVPTWALNGVGLACLAAVAVGWWRMGARGRLAAAAILLVLGGLVIQQRWLAQYAYGYFKALTTAVVPLTVLLGAGLAALWRRRDRRWRGLAAGGLLLLVGVNLKHDVWGQSVALRDSLALNRDLIEVGQAASLVDPQAWVLLDLPQGIRQHWLGYLIRERKIRYREPLWFGDIETPGAADAYFRYAVVDRGLDPVRHRLAPDEPWYHPATFVRRAGNEGYELRERIDAQVSSVELRRRWPDDVDLLLAVARSPARVTANLGPEAMAGAAGEGVPRTIQLRLYNLGAPIQLEARPFDARPVAMPPVTLGPGGWLLDLDLDCLSEPRVALHRTPGDVLLADVRVLRRATGSPSTCFEHSALSSGAMFVEQSTLGYTQVQLRATLVRPEGDRDRPYRFGFHAFEQSQGKVLGVWTLDFPVAPRIQRGSVEIDLSDRSARGEIDGRVTAVEFTKLELDTGTFIGQAVWWALNPHELRQAQPILWFHRRDGGEVQIFKSLGASRLQVIASP